MKSSLQHVAATSCGDDCIVFNPHNQQLHDFMQLLQRHSQENHLLQRGYTMLHDFKILLSHSRPFKIIPLSRRCVSSCISTLLCLSCAISEIFNVK